MKKMFKRTLAVLLVVVMTIGSAPLSGLVGLELPEFNFFETKAEATTSGTCGDNLAYSFDEDTGILTISGTGTMTNFSYDFLGSFVMDSDVPWYSFKDSVTSIQFDNGISSVGDFAFYACSGLTSVIIPDSVTSIGNYAFSGCTGLTSVTIPDSVTSIGNYAFSGCTGLASVTIPDSVTSIGDYAFSGCTGLTSVTIPNSVTSIGCYAFRNCESLVSIKIPEGVLCIEEGTFFGCLSLTNITIPKSVKRIYCGDIMDNSDSAFFECQSLADVYYGGNETDWESIDFFTSGSDTVINPLRYKTIHYNTIGTETDESVNPEIKFGANKNTIGEDITGSADEITECLIVYTSADYDTTSLTVKSSNTNVVSIGSIAHDSGDYICGENEHRAAVQLNFKAKGTAAITVTSLEGISESITVTVEEKEKSIAVFTTNKSFTVKPEESMWLAFGMLVDGELDDNWDKMAVTVSDPTIVSLSEYEETAYGYSLEVNGKKEGSTKLTITDTATGISTIIVVSVMDSYSKSYSYAINDIATFYPNNKWENHIATNIYDLNGLYVNNYSCSKSGSTYYVSFDVYNQRYHFGAIDIYDADGNWVGSEAIEKYSDISSLYDTGEQIVYMVIDAATGSWLTYEQAMLSKKTTINIEVPEGGYFTISNNFVESQGAFIYNVSDILINGLITFFDVSSSIGNLKSLKPADLGKAIMDELFKEPNVAEAWMDVFTDVVSQQVTESVKKFSTSDIDVVCSEVINVFENSLNKLKIDWKDVVKSSAGLVESAFQKFAGPAGVALEACFSISNATNTIIQMRHLATSINEANITVYSSVDEGYINPHGVIVNTNGSMDSEAVLQVFRISNDDSVNVLLDSDNPLEEHELYNICFVKNDKLVQPNGKVKVYVPIPEGMDSDTCVIYRQETDGSWTILDAIVEENYLVFETDHFSLYALVGNREKLTVSSLPDKITYTRNNVLDTIGLVLKLNGETITEGYYCDPTVMYEYGTQKITVKYGKATAEFEVDVLDPGEIVSSISVYKNPTKTTYYVGDPLNTTGLQIKITYSDGSTKVISSGFAVSSFNSSTAGTKTITINYSGCKTMFSVTVQKPVLTLSENSLSLATGDTVNLTAATDPSSQTVEWSSSDTSVVKVSSGNLTALKTGETVITASFTYNGISYTADCYVTVLEPEVVLESISIHSPLVKTKYFIGDELDVSGLSLKLVYSNDTVSIITEGFAVTGFDSTTVGTQTLTVLYCGKRASFDVTVENVVLSSIAVETMPANTSYYVGDTLDTRGLTIKATYNNGVTETISSGFTCTPAVLNTVGTQKITVTYGDKTTFFNVTVNTVVLSRIVVKTNPIKMIYYVGDEIDTTGLTLIATYNNGSTEIISSGFTTSGFSSSSTGRKSVIVSYNGNLTSFVVTVVSIDLCGNNAYWAFDESTGLLTITGSGTMYNWSETYYAPWHAYCSSIKTVNIEEGITKVGNYAFENCTQLTTVTIPDSVTMIEEDAFCGCSNIKELTLPASAKIYEYSFDGCTNIEKVTLTKGTGTMQGYYDRNNNTVYYSRTPWYKSRNSIKEIVIEDGVENIGSYAFYGSINLESLIIPDSVTSIEQHAFYNCVSFTRIIIPEKVTNIESSAFECCTGLRSIVIPESVMTIGDSAFSDCSNLTSITIPSKITSVDYYTFRNCTSLTSITIPDSVISIDFNAFENCISLARITIPDSVISISWGAFKNCTGLNELVIPASAEINDSFDGCTNIEKVIITKGTGNMTNYDSYSCDGTPWSQSGKSIKEIVIEDGVENIGEYAFYNFYELARITIPDSVLSIGNYAFGYCSGLKELDMPVSAKFYKNAFIGCTNIEKVSLTKGIGIMQDYRPSISNSSTDTCYYYTSPWYQSKDSIKKLVIEEGVKNIGNYAFYNCDALTSMTIPNSVTSIDNYAFYNCKGLASITIPDSVTSIGDYAFALCTGLTDVYYNSNEEKWSSISIGTHNEYLTGATIHYPMLELISVHNHPIKTSYFVGETFDASGLTLMATYSNGKTEIISDNFTCAPTTFDTVGAQKMTVTYGGKTTCFDVTVANVVLSSISVKNNPEKTNYYIGDTLDTTGLVLAATYNNGKTETVSEGFTCIPTTLETAGTQIITVSYGGETATFNVTVEDVVISNIAVNSMPDNTSYCVGDSFDTTGLTLTATYNNGDMAIISEGFTCTPSTFNVAGTQSITISYAGKTTTINVTVEDVVLTGIAVKTNPSKTSYFVGDALDTTGLVLTATYNNGATKPVSGGFTCTPETLETAGTQEITVTYSNKSTSFIVEVKAVEISGISIANVPETLNYFVGDTLSTEGLAILVTYNNATTKTVTSGFTCTPTILETEGTQKITVTYGDKTASFNISVTSVKVTELEIVTAPKKTSYEVGDKFDPTGLTMNAVNSKGEEFIVSEGFVCTPEILDKAGTQVVTVSYGGKSIMITVIVAEAEPETYVVKFISNGEVISETTYAEGEIIVEPKVSETIGYTFTGWTPQIPDAMPADNLTFTAIWIANSYDAVFNANGGAWSDGSTEKAVSIEYGADIIVPEAPSRDGYVFSGWTPEIGVMDDVNGKTFTAIWIAATDTKYTVETYTMNTSGEYEKTSQTFSGATGESVDAEYTVPTGFKLNAKKSVLEGTIAADNSLVLKVYIDRNTYTFTTVVDGVSTSTAYLYGSMVSEPVTPSKTDYKFIKWNGTIPETMPAKNVTITAVFEKCYVCPDCGNEILGEDAIGEHIATEEKAKIKATIKIKNNNGSKTINYGETLKLTAIVTDKPADAKIYWYVDGVKKGEGETFNVSFENGTKTVEVKLVDSNGNAIKNASGNEIIDSESVTVNGGFFQKIISFFKNLFGMNRTVVQAIFKGAL